MTLAVLLTSLSIWWMAIPIIMALLIIYSVHEEEFHPPVIGAVISIGLLYFLTDVPIVDYLSQNWKSVLTYVGIYFVVGLVWSFVKWYFYLTKEKDRYQTLRAEFIEEHKANSNGSNTANRAVEVEALQNDKIPDSLKKKWAGKLSYSKLPPKAFDNKNRITTWMMYWSFSMIGTFFGEWLKEIWNVIYNLFGNVYDKISNSVFKGFEEDFK